MAALAVPALVPTAPAAGVEAPEGFIVENAFPGAQFAEPGQVLFLPDGRKLVVELDGRIWVITRDGFQLPEPFIDLRDEVARAYDLGLLGAAVDPHYTETPWVYLGYPVDPDEDGVDDETDRFVRVTRYRADPADPNVADTASRQVLLGARWSEAPASLSSSHTVGMLAFGEDGSLLVAVGDGAQFNGVDAGGLDPDGFGPDRTDPAEDMGAFRARYVKSLSGSILRINGETGLGLPSNPFWDGDASSASSRIWVYGLRNPYRFAVRPGSGGADPDHPGVLYIGDVGWGYYEELNIAGSGGTSFGWPCYEGPSTQPFYTRVDSTESGNENVLCGAPPNPDSPSEPTSPALYWHHTNGDYSHPTGWVGRVVTGGAFYTGERYPAEYHGLYFVADFFEGWIRATAFDEDDDFTGWSEFITGADGPVHLTCDPESGDLYYVSLFESEVRRVRYAGPDGGDPSSVADLAVSAFPNPFRGMTWIGVETGRDARLTLSILTPDGRVIATLLESSEVTAGRHVVEWHGLTADGRSAASGVYFARVRAGGRTATSKIVLR